MVYRLDKVTFVANNWRKEAKVFCHPGKVAGPAGCRNISWPIPKPKANPRSCELITRWPIVPFSTLVLLNSNLVRLPLLMDMMQTASVSLVWL